jgi:hypothetical protein
MIFFRASYEPPLRFLFFDITTINNTILGTLLLENKISHLFSWSDLKIPIPWYLVGSGRLDTMNAIYEKKLSHCWLPSSHGSSRAGLFSVRHFRMRRIREWVFISIDRYAFEEIKFFARVYILSLVTHKRQYSKQNNTVQIWLMRCRGKKFFSRKAVLTRYIISR